MSIENKSLDSLPKYLVTAVGVIQITSRKRSDGESQPEINSLEKSDTFIEGGIKQIVIEVRARSADLRKKAIEENGGYDCCICGFNFQDIYGDFGVDYIEVHHLVPLSNSDADHSVGVKDVAVVCANCHRVLHHYGEEPIPVETLKSIVEERRRFTSYRR